MVQRVGILCKETLEVAISEMDQGNEIFIKDYEALKGKITYYPGISIVSVDKDPPEQYVIEYRLFGYGYDDNGQVQMLRRHRIEIKLPFGYPHFPPTVQPLSKICHPDVAEHAIRIAEFWQSNQSLADLVVHIGDMIRGAVYSTDGAFNEEAARWYTENAQKLPLAELEYNDPNARPKKRKGGPVIPYRLLGIAVLTGMVITGGGLVVRDKMILAGAGEALQQLHSSMENRKFAEADAIGQKTVKRLRSVLFFSGDSKARLAEIAAIVESESLKEGLAGRIEYKGQYLPISIADALVEVERLTVEATAKLDGGDVEAATTTFSTAIRLAEKNGQSGAADNVRRISAEKRLGHYVEKASGFYSEQEWQKAADLYSLAVTILENEKDHLSAESLETLEKLVKLKILALASVAREEAVRAENIKDYAVAAARYRAIVVLIQRNEFGNDPVLAKVGSDAEAERQRLAELAMVAEGSAYLVENFKKLFMEHYPGLYEPGLQSPKVRYLGRNEGKLVFIMSCIELVQRNTNEFRLSYQFDPVTRSWSLYRE